MVTEIDKPDERFRVETIDGTVARSRYVIAATVIDGDYLESLDPTLYDEDDHAVDCDDRGRTEVDGLYVAGRLADATHQAIICAGDGAKTAHALITDVLRDRGYWDEIASQYTDWVVRERPDDDWVPASNRGYERPFPKTGTSRRSESSGSSTTSSSGSKPER